MEERQEKQGKKRKEIDRIDISKSRKEAKEIDRIDVRESRRKTESDRRD